MSTRRTAILIMLGGVAAFSLLDASLKHLTVLYPTNQVMSLRAAASLPWILGAVAWSRRWDGLRVGSVLEYLLRGLLYFFVLWSFVLALGLQSLSYTYAIFMSAPLVAAALAWPLLGERVTLRRLLAILIGLCGVVVALRPDGNFAGLGGLAAAGSAIGYALFVIMVRRTGEGDSNFAVVFWNLSFVFVAAGVLALPDWRPIAPQSWPWILFSGLAGALGQYCFTAAFRLAPISTVAPFEYTAMFWAVMLDWFVFSTVPAVHVLLGAAIVIGAGLYVIWDERRTDSVLPIQMPAG